KHGTSWKERPSEAPERLEPCRGLRVRLSGWSRWLQVRLARADQAADDEGVEEARKVPGRPVLAHHLAPLAGAGAHELEDRAEADGAVGLDAGDLGDGGDAARSVGEARLLHHE